MSQQPNNTEVELLVFLFLDSVFSFSVTNSTINEPKDRVKKNLTFEAAASKPAVPVSEFAPALSIPAALAVLKPAAVAVSKPTAVAVSKPAAVAVSEPAACAVSKPVPSCYKEVKGEQTFPSKYLD